MKRRIMAAALLMFLLLLGNSASAQSLWVLHQDQPEILLTELDLPSGKVLTSFRPTSFSNIQDGGLALDKFHNELIACDGYNLFGISLFSFAERQIAINGSNPFFSPISGMAILYGKNNRPKWLFCSSSSLYSYIDMRTWTWASQTWPIPNGGFSVIDIAIGVSYYRSLDIHVPVLYAVENSGPMVMWNPVAAIRRQTNKYIEKTNGTGLYSTKMTCNTNLPQFGIFDELGTHDTSGTIYGLGILNGSLVIKDVSGNGGEVIIPDIRSRNVIGIAYSAQISPIGEFEPHDFVYGQSTLPIDPKAPKRTRVYLERSETTHYPYFVLSQVPRIFRDSERGDFLTGVKYIKARFDGSRYFVDVSSEPTVLYGQWAFKEHGFRSNSRILFSEPAKIPISNLQ